MKKKLGTMDLILLVIGIFLALFTTAMIIIHCITGSTPDVLIENVYKICGFECGAMGVIKSVKLFNLKQKLKSERETCNNSGENSNYTLNYCEESADFEEITEIPEVENELEKETFE